MPYVHVNGFRMFYDEAGNGDAAVFVHGGFASVARQFKDPREYRAFGDLDTALAAQFRYVRYDRRGCRLSSRPDSGYDLETQADDLRALLDHLGIDRTHLIGSSAGGPIAIVFAARHAARARKLVLVGTGLDLFPRGDPPSEIVRRQIETLEADGPDRAFMTRPAGVEAGLDVLWGHEEASAKDEGAEWRAEQDEAARRAAQLPHHERVAWYAAELRSAAAYVQCDVAAYARQLTLPTLILHGTADREVYFTSAEAMARTMPRATFAPIEGGHHGLLYTNTAARQRALAFLSADT